MKSIVDHLDGVDKHILTPSRTEPLAAMTTEFFGGPTGAYAVGPARRLPGKVAAVLIVGAAFLVIGFLAKSPCMSGIANGHGGYGLNWSGGRQYLAACYNDIMPLFGIEGFKDGHFPYAYHWLDHGVVRYNEYPVLTGLFMWVCAVITRAIYPAVIAIPASTVPEATVFFVVTALIMAALWLVTIRIVGYLCGNRYFDSLLVAASPLVAIHAFTNWDIIPCACAVIAFALMARNKPMLAGIIIGVGTAFKLWPLYLLGAYLVLAIRTKRFRPFLLALGGALGVLIVVNAPIIALYPQGWSQFIRLNEHRGWEWTTIWAWASRVFGFSGFPKSNGTPVVLNQVTFGLFVLVCIAVLVVGLKSRKTPRVAQLAFLIVAGFLLVNKVYSPQYSLWLVPLAALALPYWRLVFAWALTDAMLWPVLMWHMAGTNNKGLPHAFLDIMVVGRDGFIIAICVCIVVTMMSRTRPDLVYEAHAGRDPLAGPFHLPNPANLVNPRSTEVLNESERAEDDNIAETTKMGAVAE